MGSGSIKKDVVLVGMLLQRDLDAITMGFLNYITMIIRNGMELIAGGFDGGVVFTLCYDALYNITC